jgi:signal peptidase I
VTATGPISTYRVPSPAMAPTLRTGEHVAVSLDPRYTPRIGDIVVFHPPAGADAEAPICGNPQQGAGCSAACSTPTSRKSSGRWIKRIVAGPGDTLTLRDGAVIRNREPQEEPYSVLPCDKGLQLGLPPDPLATSQIRSPSRRITTSFSETTAGPLLIPASGARYREPGSSARS